MALNSKTEIRAWANEREWDVFATLTFKGYITDKRAAEAIRHFFNLVDYGLYGHAGKRYNRHCERLNFIEGSEHGERWHYHCLIALPKARFSERTDFINFLYAHWKKVIGNGYMSEIKGIYDSRGIVGYATKKIAITDAMTLDVHSSHINAAD